MSNKIINLNKDEVRQILTEYFSKDNKVSVEEELSLCNGNPDLKFYLMKIQKITENYLQGKI